MSQITVDDVIEPSAPPTPTSPDAGPLPFEQLPKLKGHRRILQSLQRMSSSPSLARLGRNPPSSYRSGGKASMSCVSFSSAMTPSATSPSAHSYGNSYSSNSTAGFSTAPTSVVGSPGAEQETFEQSARIRIIGSEPILNGITSATSVPLPKDVQATPSGTEMRNDYFSKPVKVMKRIKKRPNFDFWGEMPQEVRIQILQFLSPKEIVRCSAVSKTWRHMCFDGQLWRRIDTDDYYRQIPGDSLVKILTTAGPFVRDLNLRGCVQLRERWGMDGQKIAQACQNLENFSLEGCRIDKSSIQYLLSEKTRLVNVNVSGLSSVNNHTMRIIADGCKQLEYLNVSWCQHITTAGLMHIVKSCAQLKDLQAGEIRGWDDQDFVLELFQRNTLERLIVSHCGDLNDDSLQILVHGKEPEIDPLSDVPIVPPRRLRHLDLSRCKALTTKGIKSLAYVVTNLEGLQLSHIDSLQDDALTGILASTPSLTHLDLEELDTLTNAFLLKLASAPCVPHLQHLNISYCEQFGDVGLIPVLKAASSIRSLVLDNTRVSDLSLAEAAIQLRARDRHLHPQAHTTFTPASIATAAINAFSRDKTPSQHQRPGSVTPTSLPSIALSIVAYDCQNITWTGVREILSQNSSTSDSPYNQPRSLIIGLKCFYGYQDTVNEHTKRVLRGDYKAAARLERKWGEYMLASEEAGAVGAGARRRRRRAREAAMQHADEAEGGPRGGRRRARSGGCTVM